MPILICLLYLAAHAGLYFAVFEDGGRSSSRELFFFTISFPRLP